MPSAKYVVRRIKKSDTSPLNITATERPSLLLPHPEPLEQQVVMSGPERIVTGWWDNSPVVRDYFIAKNTQKQWLRFETCSSNGFYTVGLVNEAPVLPPSEYL